MEPMTFRTDDPAAEAGELARALLPVLTQRVESATLGVGDATDDAGGLGDIEELSAELGWLYGVLAAGFLDRCVQCV